MAAMAHVGVSSFSALLGAHISIGRSPHHLICYCMQVNDGLKQVADGQLFYADDCFRCIEVSRHDYSFTVAVSPNP